MLPVLFPIARRRAFHAPDKHRAHAFGGVGVLFWYFFGFVLVFCLGFRAPGGKKARRSNSQEGKEGRREGRKEGRRDGRKEVGREGRKE